MKLPVVLLGRKNVVGAIVSKRLVCDDEGGAPVDVVRRKEVRVDPFPGYRRTPEQVRAEIESAGHSFVARKGGQK